jgi:hypothetical protein
MRCYALAFILTTTAAVAPADRSSQNYLISDELIGSLFPLDFSAPSYFVIAGMGEFATESFSKSYSILSGNITEQPLPDVHQRPEIIRESIEARDGQIRFLVRGRSGQSVVVEASSDLLHWVTVATTILSDVPWEFADVSTQTRRFYRAVVPPPNDSSPLRP